MNTSPDQPAEPTFVTALIEDRRKRYGLDPSCTPAFLHWLDTETPRQGIAANVAWNAGYACALLAQPAPVAPSMPTV